MPPVQVLLDQKQKQLLKKKLLELRIVYERILRVLKAGLSRRRQRKGMLGHFSDLVERVHTENLKLLVLDRELTGTVLHQFQQLDEELAREIHYFVQHHDKVWKLDTLAKTDPQNPRASGLSQLIYELETMAKNIQEFFIKRLDWCLAKL